MSVAPGGPFPVASRLAGVPWGPRQAGVGLLLAVGVFVLTQVLLVVVAASGHDFAARDIGDIFEKATAIAKYGDERLQAATEGHALPDAPRVLADPLSITFLIGATFITQGCFIFIPVLATRLGTGRIARAVGLRSYGFGDLWRPGLAVVAAYLLTALYAAVISLTNIGILEPKSTVPTEITRHASTLAMTGVLAVLAAPIAEELFFRGLIFGGFLRWGFWPAAAISAGAFAVPHLDPGSMIPFFGIGMLLAWLFWARGSLWDSIAFHFLFNGTSFVILAGTA